MDVLWVTDFKENTIFRIEESTRMIGLALEKISDEHVWQRPNNSSNSIGNQLLHLCGNMTQYVISNIGEKPDMRDRDAEFDATEGYTKDTLLKMLITTATEVIVTIKHASEAQLLKKRHVQGFYFSGMGAIIHAVEHYSYHTGQIAFWVKELVDAPLGFYDGQDLNATNKL